MFEGGDRGIAGTGEALGRGPCRQPDSAGGAVTAAAAAAGAAPPAPFGGTFEIDGYCSFTVVVEVDGKAGTIERPDGSFILTSPGLDATVTNEETGATERYSITGAFHQTVLPSGNTLTRTTGRSLLGDPEAGLVIASGDFSFESAPDGSVVVPLSGTGRLVDVCEVLSD